MTHKTKLIEWRKASKSERKKHNAEVVFVREDAEGRKHTIYGARCYESWEQWGEVPDILSDNVSAIEAWRRG